MGLERNELQDLLVNIKLQPFKKAHYPLLIEMLESNEFPDIKEITRQSLPKLGFIATLGAHPIAAGFLRRVECDIVAQIDSLTTNAHFGGVIRHAGIVKVIDALIIEAKALKLEGIIAFTNERSIIERAKEMGFNITNHSVMALSLVD